MAINCIDISTWNSNVNYRAVRSDGISAAILRAGFGREVSQIDSQFENHYKGCRDAGLKIGIYWYSYADSISDAETEARACLAILNGRQIDLPVYFDMEEAWQTSLGMQTLTAMAERFCETIKQGGYKAGVYSNLNWFYNYLDYDPCDIWQNSETGDINGINGNCDTNVILNWDIMGESAPEKNGVTAQDAVNMAYSLINTDVNPRKCDIMEWYGGFDDDLDEEACCCAEETAEAAADAVKDAAEEACCCAEETAEAAADAVEEVCAGAEEAAEAAADAAGEAAETVTDAAEEACGLAEEAAGAAADAAGEVKDGIFRMAEDAGDQAEDALKEAGETAKGVFSAVKDLFRRD